MKEENYLNFLSTAIKRSMEGIHLIRAIDNVKSLAVDEQAQLRLSLLSKEEEIKIERISKKEVDSNIERT